MNKVIILIVLAQLALLASACSKKDLNLPQPSPMPERIISETEPGAMCGPQFRNEMSLAELALTAYEIQKNCGASKDEIIKLTKKLTAGAGIVFQAEHPVFF